MALTSDFLSASASVSGVAKIVGGLFALLFLYLFLLGIYRVYFHPLAGYPGNVWYTAFPIATLRNVVSGRQYIETKKLHDKYGDVVRMSYNVLSYNNPAASKDIYVRPGKDEFPKHPNSYRPPPNGVRFLISTIDKEEHARQRALLSHSFSDKSLKDQEPLIMKYVDLMIRQLKAHCNDGPLNMTSVFNWATFDLISDLSYGEPFHCLEDFKTHPWMTWTFKSFKAGAFMSIARRIPVIGYLVVYLMVPDLIDVMKKRIQMFDFTTQKTLKRLRAKTDRKDFMSAVLENDKDLHLTEGQMVTLCNLLMIAGSETTATALTGAVSLLAENRDVLEKVTKEIRDTFEREEDITIVTANSLKYLNAVLTETLRVFPPVPGGGPRLVVNEGEKVLGRYVPPGTEVLYHQYSAYHSAKNFRDPDKFVPERWLGDERYADDQRIALRPFLSGPRNCIGINLANTEMRLILSRLLWNFDLGQPTWKGTYTTGRKQYVLWEKPPLYLELTPRKSITETIPTAATT